MTGLVLLRCMAVVMVVGCGAAAQNLGKVVVKNASQGRLEVCINGQYQGSVPIGKTMFTVREKFLPKEGDRPAPRGGKATASEPKVELQDQSDLSFFAWSVGQDGAIRHFGGSLPFWLGEISVVCGSEELPTTLEIEKAAPMPKGSADCQDIVQKIESASALFQGKYKGDGVSADLTVKDGVVRGTITRPNGRISVRGELFDGPVLLEYRDGEKTVSLTATATPTTLTLVDPSSGSVELQKQQLPQGMPGKTSFTPTHRIDDLRMDFVFLKPGKFVMGSESGHEMERNVRTVELRRGFFLGRTEVTQAQFRAVMRSEPWAGREFVLDDGEAAASYVSWDDATKFCQLLNRFDRNLPRGFEYRLPTEAEWEYGCRAGTTGDYSCPVFTMSSYAVRFMEGTKTAYTHPVGTRHPNPWGLYDMHGNAYEWVRDVYWPYDVTQTVNPVGPPEGEFRVLRGGSWDCVVEFLKSSTRVAFAPEARERSFGFRVALALRSAR